MTSFHDLTETAFPLFAQNQFCQFECQLSNKQVSVLTNHSTSSKSFRYREGARGCDADVSKYCANPRMVTGDLKKLFEAGDVNDPGRIAIAPRLPSDRCTIFWLAWRAVNRFFGRGSSNPLSTSSTVPCGS